jgi:hypothetical protein
VRFGLSPSTWIAIYVPLYLIFFIIIPQKRQIEKAILLKIRRRKGVLTMTNEILRQYIGKTCKVSTGSLGTTVVGKILEVNENWLELETKKGKELINADFIQSIKVKQIY